MPTTDRASLFTLLSTDESLDGFIVYAEPPETLVGQSIVIAPRDPYQDYASFGTLTTFLSVAVLVPRSHGPAMDLIDSTLAILRGIFDGLGGCEVGDTHVGLLEEVGGTEYIAAMVNVSLA